MIDYERVRNLRDLRLFSFVMGVVCASVIALDIPIVAYGLLALFACFFVVRFIEYTEKLRELELYNDLPVRDRRKDRMG